MKKGIVDRFEGKWVVIEINGITKDFPISLIKGDVEEGDVVHITNDSIIALKDETTKLRKEIKNLMEELFEKDDTTDI